MGDLDKLIVDKGFKKLPKVQNIAISGHTDDQSADHDQTLILFTGYLYCRIKIKIKLAERQKYSFQHIFQFTTIFFIKRAVIGLFLSIFILFKQFDHHHHGTIYFQKLET